MKRFILAVPLVGILLPLCAAAQMAYVSNEKAGTRSSTPQRGRS